RLYVPRASGSVASYFSAGGRTTAAKNCIVLPIVTPVRKPEKWFICPEQCDGIPSTEEGETTELQAAHLHPLRSGKAYFCASLPSAEFAEALGISLPHQATTYNISTRTFELRTD